VPFDSFQVPQFNRFLTNNQPSTNYKYYQTQQHTTQTANMAQPNSIHQDQFGAHSGNSNFNSESNQYLPTTTQSLNVYPDNIPNQENQFIASVTNANQQLHQSS